MSRANGDRDLEVRVGALRRELAGLVATLCNLGQRLEDLADELHSRHQAGKVIALDRDGAARVAMIRTSWATSSNRAAVAFGAVLGPVVPLG